VAVGDAVALADVGGQQAAAVLVVADGHALPAGPADDDALQQRGAFAGRSGAQDADEGVTDGADVKAPPGVSRAGPSSSGCRRYRRGVVVLIRRGVR
jgi:hypothetical protein